MKIAVAGTGYVGLSIAIHAICSAETDFYQPCANMATLLKYATSTW